MKDNKSYLEVEVPVLSIALIALVLFFIIFALTRPKGRQGMRPRGGMRWKNLLGTLMISSRRKRENPSIDPELINKRVPPPSDVERDQYNDSFVFQGCDGEGNLFLTRLGFRNGGKSVEAWLWMILRGEKYFNTDPLLEFSRPGEGAVSGAGLIYECDDLHRGNWNIGYEGNLSPAGVKCRVNLKYEPQAALYDSAIHMDPAAFAKAMAEMRWNRDFFSNLRSESQRRIEQGGSLQGLINLGEEEHRISMTGIRDHSWGKRDWNFINRYIWNVLSFDKGIEIGGEIFTYLCYTTVNYGTTFKCLVSGWIAGENRVLPISAATGLEQIGEDGIIPEEIHCMFQPRGCRPYTLKIHRLQPEHSWFMAAGSFEVCEAFCRFDVEGQPGAGMSEFGYSRIGGYESRF